MISTSCIFLEEIGGCPRFKIVSQAVEKGLDVRGVWGIWCDPLSLARFVQGDSRRPKPTRSKVRNMPVLQALAVFRTC
jgi:hypothetical protein